MDNNTKSVFSMFLALSGIILVMILYYYAYPFWSSVGLRSDMTDLIVARMHQSGNFRSQLAVRLVCLFFCSIAVMVRSGSPKLSTWTEVLVPLLSGLILFLCASFTGHGLLFVCVTVIGYVLFLIGAVLVGRMYRSYDPHLPSYWDTFPQCEELIENEYSVNIPMVYQYEGKQHEGYINCVAPMRGCMIIGTPGSGKTYSIYGPFIRQMIQKQYSMFVYDYKFPDLTEKVLNELLDNYDCYKGVKPKMYFVNFDDAVQSHRFNPIHPRYLNDPIDSTEIAEVIYKNAHREKGKGDDFFALSAQCYIDMLIWFLKIYEGGKYCSFPHLVQLMGADYRDVLHIVARFRELDVKRTTFSDAMKDKAFNQLQGQIATARVSFTRFASPALYWTLSGDDFSLDINNPDEPKIICVGNNPRRQSIYGTTLAMLMSQLFKVINAPGKRHSAVLIDELPTIYLKGLDNLINTARSNLVAVVIGAQDKSQLVRDYDKKESDVIFNTVGNVFAGAVKGETAINLSKSFGKVRREIRSFQEGSTSDSVTFSYQQEDVLPSHKIEALSQGSFCGYIADTHDQNVDQKVFCGKVKAGAAPRHNVKLPKVVDLTREEMEVEIENNYRRIKFEIEDLIEYELNKPDD